jgi:hypothetical protein
MNRNTTLVIAGVTAGIVAAGAIAWAVKSFTGDSATDRTMAALRAQPLVGQVLADNPPIEAQVRTAVEEDVRQPQATSRAFLAVVAIRQTIVGPTLSAADDASALTVMRARTNLVAHLQKIDLTACRQFSGEGIRDINKLDDEGQQLFHTMLTTMEAAYRSGKANGGKGKPPSNEEFSAMLQTAGFTPDDFAKLGHLATLKDDEVCSLELRIDSAPDKLPDDKRGDYARFVIAH